MRILVVGGAGYIGSVTVDQLMAADHDVTVVDSLVSGHAEALHPECEFVQADIRDEEALARLFASHNFHAVVNYGGYIQAGESVQQPGRYFANNVGGTITLLNAMATYGVTRFVFSSSAAVYGEPDSVPITEDAPVRPVNPYGETKAMVERMLPWYQQACGLNWVALRYFNAAGATETKGEDHRPETHLIPIVLEAAYGQREFVALFGNDYPTRDGTCIRDYIHVSDLAAAHLLALDKTETGSGAYNLGSGTGASNREIIESARRVTGREIRVVEEARRPGDPASLVASNERAIAELGWRIDYPELDEIVASAWRWHQEHPQGYEG
ncbi:MAG TPA: UDP-glucose 4-epimerase GalE [Dehalococcoidia bacterium]|nr:UDP-glucose 4-epimerase GalE [Dehalococcoidia bacterium]